MTCTASNQCGAVNASATQTDEYLELVAGDAAAQTFTTSSAGMLTEVRLSAPCFARVYLTGVSGAGAPSTMQIASFEPYTGEQRRVELADGSRFDAFLADPPVQVRNGEQFAIVAEVKDDRVSCGYYSTTNVYDGGTMYSKTNSDATWTARKGDLPFQVIITPP